MTVQTLTAPQPILETRNVPISDGLLGSRRASLLFVVTVFATTAIQAVSEPIAGLTASREEWPLSIPMPVAFAFLVLGCAVQAGTFLLTDRWPAAAIVGTTSVYLFFVVIVGVPNWVVGMQLVIALAQFFYSARSSTSRAVVWYAVLQPFTVLMMFLWTMAIGTEINVAIGFVVAHGVGLAVPSLGATVLGVWWRGQARRVAEARAQAERAEREHDLRVEDARERERARIAQELHDVAGQHLAGLITLAEAALTLASTRPGEALHLVEEVRNEGRFAAASLAGALTDLRAVGAEPVEATRDLLRIDELVAYWRRRGMTVHLEVSGHFDDLPAVVSTTAYRFVQEALTNAAKHAPGAAVQVSAELSSTLLEIAVENEPVPRGTEPIPGLGLRWGLRGLRERIDLLRGTLRAGRTSDGGWAVRIRIPVLQID